MKHCSRKANASGQAILAALVLTLMGLLSGSVVPISLSSLSKRSGLPVPQVTSGGRIVFERVDTGSPTQAGSGLYIIDADGVSLRRLSRSGDEPAFSHDGTKVAFVSGQPPLGCNNHELNSMASIFGTDQRPLTNVCGYDQHPSWSPDGTKIAFWSDRDAGEGLYVMNADGSDQTRIVNTSSIQRLVESPNWSPDGTRIAFIGYNLNTNNEADIFIVNVDGSNPIDITNTPTISEVAPAWSRDGNKLAYVRVTSPDDSDIYTMNANGSNQTQLTGLSITGLGIILGLGELKLAWSPDGTRLAFMDVGNSLDIFTVNADGSNRMNLTNTPDNDTYPDWQTAALVPTTNPIDDARFFVRQHYRDFLSREPDPDGWDYWTSQLTSCGSDDLCIRARRIAVSDAFFFEPEFNLTGGYIYRIYKTTLGVNPTFAEFRPDRAQVVGGANLDQAKTAFALSFVQRPAFVTAYPAGMTALEFVDKVVLTIQQNSQVDLSSLKPSLIPLYDGTNNGRAVILRQVADNQQLIDGEYNRLFVLHEYFAYLRRDPEPDGYNFWLGQLNRFPLRDVNIQHAMVCSFITSIEYQLRFSIVVTHSNQECPQ